MIQNIIRKVDIIDRYCEQVMGYRQERQSDWHPISELNEHGWRIVAITDFDDDAEAWAVFEKDTSDGRD